MSRLARSEDWGSLQVSRMLASHCSSRVQSGGEGAVGSVSGQEAGTNKSLDFSYLSAFLPFGMRLCMACRHPFHVLVPQSETQRG